MCPTTSGSTGSLIEILIECYVRFQDLQPGEVVKIVKGYNLAGSQKMAGEP
jgi:hypothetical protein